MTQKPEIINIEALDTARNLLGERFSVIIKYFLIRIVVVRFIWVKIKVKGMLEQLYKKWY